MATPITPQALQRRKRVQARLSATGALVGLGALGASGARSVALRRGPGGAQAARRLDSAITQGLTTGAGIGGIAGLHSASISRAEGRQSMDSKKIVKAYPLGTEAADAARALRRAHDAGAHAAALKPDCVQCKRVKALSRPIAKSSRLSAFGVEH